MTVYNQERVGDYIQTITGNHFYINNPSTSDFSVEDIAYSLSNLCRFTGHSPRFYSVGEHSLACLDVAIAVGATPLQCLHVLFHDASESVMNDLARPVKQNVPDYKALEDKISKVMWEVVGVSEPTEEDYEFIKKVDNTLIILEMKCLMGREDYDDGSLDSFINEISSYPNMIDKKVGFGASESTGVMLEEYERLMKLYYAQVDSEVNGESK